jgi:hypothetical protein
MPLANSTRTRVGLVLSVLPYNKNFQLRIICTENITFVFILVGKITEDMKQLLFELFVLNYFSGISVY